MTETKRTRSTAFSVSPDAYGTPTLYRSVRPINGDGMTCKEVIAKGDEIKALARCLVREGYGK
jgi:hypothetical protein